METQQPPEELAELHWLMTMLQNVDLGLVVLDRNLDIQLWNGFMSDHSGLRPDRAMGRCILDLFPEIPGPWFRRKVESVFMLRSLAFTIWEQRPYVFRFGPARPITGAAEFMYQNLSIIPLTSLAGDVDHVCLVISDVTDVAMSKQAMIEANGQLESLSRTDRLTNLWNRGYWEECLEQEFLRARRYGQPTTLALLDIDHFKRVNDDFGHPAGDEVIRTLAATMLRTARTTDVCGRYGGEEFAVILADTDVASSTFFGERLRRQLAKTSVAWEGEEITFTISVGLAQFEPGMTDRTDWIEAADRALYRSKAEGRDRVSIYESSL